MMFGFMSKVKAARWNNSVTALNFSESEPSNIPRRTAGLTVAMRMP